MDGRDENTTGKRQQEKIERLCLWVEQHEKGVGELHLDAVDRESEEANPYSTIVFLDEVEEQDIIYLANVALKIPMEYGGMGGALGFRWDAMRWYLKKFKIKKKMTTLMVDVGRYRANGINSRK